MNKKVAMAVFLAFVLFFSISAIQASDVNVDGPSLNSGNDVSLQIQDCFKSDELGATNSNNVSTNDNQVFLKENVKNKTELSSPASRVYVNGSYGVVLKDVNTNNVLANKKINFIINNIAYTATTDANGIAGVNLNINPGTYTVMAYFNGDNDFEVSNLTSEVRIASTIQAKNLTKYYNGATQYMAKFLDSKGNLLVNKIVTITVNGNSYTRKTNSKGLISLPMNFKPGIYKVVSTNPLTGYKLTTTFEILSTITSYDLKKVIGDDNRFVVKFFKKDGKPLANKQVKIKINGKTYKYKTDSNGLVSLSFNSYKKGTYDVVSYNTDGLSKTNKVTLFNVAITKLTTADNFYTFLPNDAKEIKVKFTTSLGGNSNSGKNINVNINGVTYSKKTDVAGMICLNASSWGKGIYTVKFDYYGNKFFNPSSATNLVTILDGTAPILTAQGRTDFGYGAGTSFKVALTAGGVPLVNRIVTFTIGGKSYTDITDNKGIASTPINLDIGNHVVDCRSYDEFKVNGTSESFIINVFKRSDSKLTWECGTSYKDSSQTFKVSLTDSSGKPIRDGNVELTIDGETYTAKTASNGYAEFTTSVALGKYKVSVTFTGNNDYLPSSTSSSINVELSKFGKGLNEKNAGSGSSAYGKSSSHCPVNNAKIKALVKSLTSGLTNNVDKVKAIFNYVRYNITYVFYYNTRRGAVGTLNAKSGNCVDKSHLLVSMYRTAGFKARYVHGRCLFSSGYIGHVWTQVLVDNTWICGDPSNRINDLGKIANWNTNSYKIRGKYVSPPF